MNDAGRIGFVIKGEYENTATYDFLDVVYYSGASYAAKKLTTGNVPQESDEYWQVLAKSDTLTNISDAVVNFETSTTRENIQSAEDAKTLFGKIRKWYTDLKTVAFTGNYGDLENKPSIPAPAKDGKLIIQRNGIQVQTFTANQSANTTANIEVPSISNSSAVTITGQMALDAVEKNASVQGTLANSVEKIQRKVSEYGWILQTEDEGWVQLTNVTKPGYVRHIYALMYAAPGQITLHVSLALYGSYNWESADIIIHSTAGEMDLIIDESRTATSFIALMPGGWYQDHIAIAEKDGTNITIKIRGDLAEQDPENIFDLTFNFPRVFDY